MNLSEYQLLSKEDIFKMYENVCEELQLTENKLGVLQSDYESLQEEFEDLQYTFAEAVNSRDCC